MHRSIKILLVVGVLAGLPGAGMAQKEPAAPATALSVSEFQLSDFQGQIVLVDFWASWCVPCRHSLPWLNAMQEKYGEQGLQVVMINLDREPAAAATMAADIDGNVRQFVDPEGDLAARYELEGMPSSYLYDRTGKLISSHVGFLKADGDQREKDVAAALAKEPK